ncbi:D-beta-hydroxybutyrate dehydrogenase, mitochondrial [Scyliorhinus canicula]|uniref:D-beta-hydroxybutyrate dehydrogenase, mitochondrial n=1 Tax=Scyliorhinus canicula TaxID=7830 RepID=UPI0018F2B53C|nr:D-beta-hydroxybutyrate dehydrogenase, mitochondrial [Scyliorhinus canicula]
MPGAVGTCAVFLLLGALYSFGSVAFTVCLIPPLIWIVWLTQPAAPVNCKGRAVLITGCDTGFGHILAKQLDGLGFRVFAGCLSPDGPGAQGLKKECSSQLSILKLDVTLDEDVNKVKEFVEANLPAEGLWGLVNNAGISGWGEVEWNNIQVYQRHADVNLWGSIRMTLSFIPLVRQCKGRFIFISSMSAYIHSPACSTYVITKCGIEAFSDCFRLEMKKFGVKVSVIEPGNYASTTNILKVQTTEEVWNELNDPVKRLYSKEYIQLLIDEVENIMSSKPRNPTDVTNAIMEALISPNPKARYLVVSMAERVIIFMCVHFPTWFSDAFFCSLKVLRKQKALIGSQINN